MKKVIIFTLAIMAFVSCNTQVKTEYQPLGEIALSDSTVIVDVRTPAEFSAGHIEKSINIPLNVITGKAEQLKSYKTIITVCRSGRRSGDAKSLLEGYGFTNVVNGGGWQALDAKMEEFGKTLVEANKK